MTLSSMTPDELFAIVGTLQEGLQVIDREWRYVYLNEAASRHGRRAVGELIGRTMMECYPGIEATPVFRTLERCMGGEGPFALENEFRFPDGHHGLFELRIAACEVGLTILSIDVTERRNLERQFRQAQKMEAIGRLSGSIAHDFNNLLTVILGHAGLALMDLDPTAPLHADLKAIQWAGQRASELTKQLLVMSRQQVIEARLVDLDRWLDGTEPMLARLVGEDIDLSVKRGADVPRVLVNPGQLEQVLMNLVVNARDAMPEGGKLIIETDSVMLDEGYAETHLGVQPGRHAVLSVSDTGVGMDLELQAKIFEPFFTTKEVGKGTGLGLSTVFGIVRQCGGSVWVYSEPGLGSTFKIFLPAATAEGAPVQASPEPASVRGGETVLVAEDQDAVRRITRHMLEHHGYRVIEARSAAEALALAETFDGVIELLLTDVVMPKMNGRELAQRVLAIRPGIRVLYMSGYTDRSVIDRAMLDPGTAYIQKPLSLETLGRKVREVLDGGVAAR